MVPPQAGLPLDSWREVIKTLDEWLHMSVRWVGSIFCIYKGEVRNTLVYMKEWVAWWHTEWKISLLWYHILSRTREFLGQMLNPGSKMGLETLMGHCHYSAGFEQTGWGAAGRWSSLHLDCISAVDCLKAKGVLKMLYEEKNVTWNF